MTLTPADVLLWTNITVTQTQLDAFEPAAEAKLNADGGSAITGNSRTQLLSYLIAGYVNTASASAGKQSESIGNYSYTQRSSTGTSIWIDLYKETLASLLSAAGALHEHQSPLVGRCDRHVLKLNREYPRPPGRII